LRQVTGSITQLGNAALRLVGFIGELGMLIAQAFAASPRLIFRKRGRRLAWRNLWFQMYRIGVKSIFVVALVNFCIGVILALQIVPILDQYGAADQIAAIIGIAYVRELGPLIGAVVLTGFAGAAIAAEIGSMAVNEELKAMRSHAISPIRFLVAPRVLAAMVMTTCLAVVSDITGVVGGLVSTKAVLAMMSTDYYVDLTFASIDMLDFITGLIKAAVFGVLIAALACKHGMEVRGGATGVGNATTRTVVISIVTIILVDLIFTAIFFMLDL